MYVVGHRACRRQFLSIRTDMCKPVLYALTGACNRQQSSKISEATAATAALFDVSYTVSDVCHGTVQLEIGCEVR